MRISDCSTTTASDTSCHRRKSLRLEGLITLDEKCAGARSAGNPHAACDAAGAGNGDMVRTEAPALGESCRQQLLPLTYIYRVSPQPYQPPAIQAS
jgi:hypothetical protein